MIKITKINLIKDQKILKKIFKTKSYYFIIKIKNQKIHEQNFKLHFR